MKIALPVVAVALIGTIFAVGRSQDERSSLLSPQEIAALGAGIALQNPRFAGHTEEGLPYVVRATAAEPQGAVPDRIRLVRPTGELTLDDGTLLTGEAVAGMLFRKTDKLQLFGGTSIQTSDGYRFDSRRLVLNFAERSAFSPTPVRGEGPAGSIEANRMDMSTGPGGAKDRRILFRGDVRVIFVPETSRPEGG